MSKGSQTVYHLPMKELIFGGTVEVASRKKIIVLSLPLMINIYKLDILHIGIT